MNDMLFEYRGDIYPDYLRHGNAAQLIEPIAKQYCRGYGLDIGCGEWPIAGARPIDLKRGERAEELPEGQWDYIFSSHMLEHVVNPVEVLEHWRTRIRQGGVLFLYLPHHSQKYWRPQNCRKHLHLFHPEDVADMLRDLGFVNVLHSERDLAWSFAVVGWNGEPQ
jgi:SAM-dependent methyltransferase